MEQADAAEVASWDKERNATFEEYTSALPVRDVLYERFQELWRYDDESTPNPCLLADCEFFSTKKADQDKWVQHMRDTKTGETRVVLDPNTWGETETLAGFNPSPDGKYIAFGKANAGDENPVIRVMNTETGEILPDTLKGWKQRGASWHHDNSGFYYSANPLPGEVPAGEEFYWNRVYFHKLGTPAEQDELVLDDPEVKEHFHFAGVSEDGRWLMMYRYAFNAQAIWIKDLTRKNAKPVALTTDMQNEYLATMVEDRIFIRTNHDAPNYRVMTTTTDKPGREHWREMIPEAADKLSSISGIAGHLYLTYQHNATTKIEVRDIDGEKLHDLELPTVGTAGVSGYWSKPEVWVGFSSFAHPSTTYQYSAKDRELTLYKESPIKIDVSDIVVDQVWYPSKDGTEVSMFIVRHKDAPKDGSTPFLLTGYGGFNVSMTPRFSTGYAVWVESGGGVAIPNLRGGGEYGQAWHEAGMRDQKQNVFDDFIAAAEYLVDKGYTASETAGDQRRLQRRPAGQRRGDPTPGAIRSGALPGAADRHGALPPLRSGQHLERGVRQRRRPGDVPAHPRVLALPRGRGRHRLPGDPGDRQPQRRPHRPGPRPQVRRGRALGRRRQGSEAADPAAPPGGLGPRRRRDHRHPGRSDRPALRLPDVADSDAGGEAGKTARGRRRTQLSRQRLATSQTSRRLSRVRSSTRMRSIRSGGS